jgi:hypothetical protein
LDSPYTFFKHFFTDELITKIFEETNLHSSQIDPGKPMNVTLHDIQKFLGICIITSMCHTSNVRDLWDEVLWK